MTRELSRFVGESCKASGVSHLRFSLAFVAINGTHRSAHAYNYLRAHADSEKEAHGRSSGRPTDATHGGVQGARILRVARTSDPALRVCLSLRRVLNIDRRA